MRQSDWNPYQPVIGLEVHVRLDLDSKLFCDDPYQYGSEPNTLISPVSLAYPGTLPKVNEKAIEFAIKVGLACNSEIAPEVVFDRKNYFYPDLPKGYQLTQDRTPTCKGGSIRIKSEANKIKEVRLTKIHLEEDAGKSIHQEGVNYTQVDFNRAGTALIEIVTQPELSSPEEAYSFMYEVRRLIRALGIGDGNMEQGSLRCDANVSVSKSSDAELGTKVEIKNVNSFNNVKRALQIEIERQIKVLERGDEIRSESRSFDPDTGKTHGMRTKETLTDYRYFPDPDLTPVTVDENLLNKLYQEIPELPLEKELRYVKDYQLSGDDAAVLTDSREMSAYFENVVALSANPKASANWVMGPVRSVLNEQNIEIDDFPVLPDDMACIIKWVDEGKINQNIAQKQLFPALLSYPGESLESVLEKTDVRSIAGTQLEDTVRDILNTFPKEAEMLKNGKKKLIGMFMGQIMKATKGKADPKKAKEILLRSLNNE